MSPFAQPFVKRTSIFLPFETYRPLLSRASLRLLRILTTSLLTNFPPAPTPRYPAISSGPVRNGTYCLTTRDYVTASAEFICHISRAANCLPALPVALRCTTPAHLPDTSDVAAIPTPPHYDLHYPSASICAIFTTPTARRQADETADPDRDEAT